MAAMSVMAQEQPVQAPQWSSACDSAQQQLELPSHYCACKEGSIDFHFPLDMELNDTVWFTATVSELRQGMSAYWFSDCSITLEVFAFCFSKVPTISVTVGGNLMRDIDADFINKKLDEMGETARMLSETLIPYIRAYPNNGGSGRVYCYPYDQGPESTCEDPLPLRSGMTYVCDKPYNTYRMDWKTLPTSGNAFIHWKQKKNLPGEIWLTLDSCNGEEVGRVELTDSLHVYIPDSAMLVDARKDKRELWMHVQHEEGLTGRAIWYNKPKFAEPLAPVTKKTCSGKTVTVNLRTYETDTVFTDLLWVAKDTLTTMDVNLTFTQPTLEYDTLYLTQAQLNVGYRYTSGDIFREFGDYDIYIKKANTCTRHILVTVLEKREDPPVDPHEALDEAYTTPVTATKSLQNGQLIIRKNGRKYNVFGQSMK